MRMTKSERRIIRHLKRVYGIEEQNAKRKKEKVSGQFMNRVVIAMILAAFIFTVVMIFVFVRTGSEPSTLIENVFRFLSVEGGAMALIKSVKTVTRRKSESTRERRKRRETSKSQDTIMSRSFIILWFLPVMKYSCRGCMSFPAGAFRTGAHITERSTSKSG